MDKTKRQAIIAGNWKMNKTPAEAKELLNAVAPLVKDADCEVIACVPFVDLQTALEVTEGKNIKIGAENCHWAESGAFTGEISTGMLNDILSEAMMRTQPPSDKGKRLKIYYMTQNAVAPPTFVLFCNSIELFHFSYQRYLENCLRETFGFEGTPIKMIIKQKGD